MEDAIATVEPIERPSSTSTSESASASAALSQLPGIQALAASGMAHTAVNGNSETPDAANGDSIPDSANGHDKVEESQSQPLPPPPVPQIAQLQNVAQRYVL